MADIIPIVKEPNKILRKKTDEVSVRSIIDPKIQRLILSMKETLKNTHDGVGLAAPQVNESLRIFIVSEEALEIDRVRSNPAKTQNTSSPTKDSNEVNLHTQNATGTLGVGINREWKYYVFINPTVKNTSRRKLEGPEGCLSIPGKFGNVARHEKITVEAYDETGKKFTRGASKFFARVIQHELDHLSGELFIDKANNIFESEKHHKNES